MNLTSKEILEIILSRYVVIFGGRYSRGKSLSLTALNFFDILFNKRNNIIANMPVKSSFDFINFNVIPLTHTSIFDNLPDNYNILYDEIHLDLNARSSNDVRNRYIGIFGRDIAKINGRLRGSVQFFDTLDKIMGLLLEMIIIPEYLNKYSNNPKEDNIQRLQNKDFNMIWKISDRREQQDYELSLNLYPYIFMYNTKFKTQPLWINHKTYLEKLEKKKGEYQLFLERNDDEILSRQKIFNDGFKEIGKEMIR